MNKKNAFIQQIDEKYEEKFRTTESKILNELESQSEGFWVENIEKYDQLFKEVYEEY